jgi:hypothetical protein
LGCRLPFADLGEGAGSYQKRVGMIGPLGQEPVEQ